jgi:hypothetical protein
LAEAAVATGAVAMPVKLPPPDLGTEAQPEPKSMVVAAPDPAAAAEEPDAIGAEEDAAGVDEPEPEAAVEEPLELQAATPKAQLRASPDTAMKLCFTIFSLRDVCSLGEVRLGAAPRMRPVR